MSMREGSNDTDSWSERSVVVAGGTGNVGGFIVDALLERGATVAVPSRSDAKLVDLRNFLEPRRSPRELERLVSLVGDLSDEETGHDVLERIEDRIGRPTAALASLGQFRPAPSLLDVARDDLDAVFHGYVVAHQRVASVLLPRLTDAGSAYVFVNGPLAFDVWPGTGSGLISIATAAQHMLFRALAQELQDAPAQVTELVTHAFIRNRTTQGPSPIPGEAVGAYAAHLLAGSEDRHGTTLHVQSPQQLKRNQAGMLIVA